MKILNFNVERLLNKSKIEPIMQIIESYKADIVILTETNSEKIKLNSTYFCQHSATLSKNHDDVDYYRNGENRVSIYSKYPITRKIYTSDEFASLAVEIETNYGNLIVYGTIIGVFGYSADKRRFIKDFNNQAIDFENIFTNNNVCLVGDLNISMTGRVYPSTEYRNKLNKIIEKYELDNSTGAIENNVDHILISKKIIGNLKLKVETFNVDKKLSDHIGICLTLV